MGGVYYFRDCVNANYDTIVVEFYLVEIYLGMALILPHSTPLLPCAGKVWILQCRPINTKYRIFSLQLSPQRVAV